MPATEHANPPPLLTGDAPARLRDALLAADYAPDGVQSVLGPAAAAQARGDLVTARLLAAGRPDGGHDGSHDSGHDTDDGPLATLVRLFLLMEAVPAEQAKRALDPLPLERAHAAGLLLPAADDHVRAGLDLRPHGWVDGEAGGTWWVVADLGADQMANDTELRPDYVLGIGPSSVTLAEATVRPPVATALDVGTGCGVQALYLSRHSGRVTATDVTDRALAFAATTAALNGQDWELLHGDLLEPVAGRRYDLVVSNPPFVVGPGHAGGVASHPYRDSGRTGDGIAAELIAHGADVLADGGWLQLLANWLHVAGQPWTERVASWVAPTGCEAWVVQREVLDPPAYVSLWLRDAGQLGTERGQRLAERWLTWFADQRVEGIGLGLVTLHSSGECDPTVRIEEMRQQVDAPVGPHVRDRFARMRWLRGADLTAATLRAAPELRLQQTASGGGDGWQVDTQLLALDGGLRWAEEVDPVTVALVGGCDGRTRLGDQLEVLAAAYDTDPAVLAAAALPAVAHLVERGMLLPASETTGSGSPCAR
jgi:methylase of polypeptide subunit release factors